MTLQKSKKIQHCRIKPRSTTDDDSSSSSSSSDSGSDDEDYSTEGDAYRVSLTQDVDLDIPRRGRMRSSEVYMATLGHKVICSGSLQPRNSADIFLVRFLVSYHDPPLLMSKIMICIVWAGNLLKGFVICFLKIPQSVGTVEFNKNYIFGSRKHRTIMP